MFVASGGQGAAFIKPPKLAAPLYNTDANAVLCSILGPGTIPPPGSVT
jgi:hypothetical protein